jgi:hypothetical protein
MALFLWQKYDFFQEIQSVIIKETLMVNTTLDSTLPKVISFYTGLQTTALLDVFSFVASVSLRFWGIASVSLRGFGWIASVSLEATPTLGD